MGQTPRKNKSIHRRLTWLIWQQRLRSNLLAIGFLLAIIVLISVGLYWQYDKWEDVEWDKGAQIYGVVVNFTHREDYDGGASQVRNLIVKLDSGQMVTVGRTSNLLFQKGRRILVREEISKKHEKRRYRFVKYIN